MTFGINIFVVLSMILIIEEKIKFSDGFLIPPYHYNGFMGGSYFPCNWGYTSCSYFPPDYYYDNGCGCVYDLGGCAPCALESPSVLEVPSYPGLPFFPELILGSPNITESPKVTTEENDSLGLAEVTPALRSDTASGKKKEEEEEEEENDEEDEEEEDENGEDYYDNNENDY
jgi:hypothetical protein